MRSWVREKHNGIGLHAFLLVGSAVAAHVACAQSFDCEKASTTIERAICADRSLSGLDNDLERELKEALLRAPARRQTLLGEERRWLAYRNRQCTRVSAAMYIGGCLRSVYRERIEQLKAMQGDPAASDLDACEAVRAYYQARLESPNAPIETPFQRLASPWQQLVGGPPPPPHFKPHLDINDYPESRPHIDLRDAFIDGIDASFAAVTLDQSCNTVANYEVWSPDKRHYRGSIADASGRPPDGNYPQLFSIRGRAILLHEGSGGSPEDIDVLGFSRDLSPVLLCRVVLEPQQPEKLLSAADQDLCAAVQRQEVNVITLEAVEEYAVWQKPPDFARGLPGFETPSFLEGSAIQFVMMSAHGVVDIANEGHPRGIAMVKAVGSACAGCGCDDASWEWPVVTTKEGAPDLDSPISRAAHSAGNRTTKLIRYRAKVYLDARGWPGDGSIHTVTAISGDGKKKMCELEPLQYVVRPPNPE